jgi:hypothetical protein
MKENDIKNNNGSSRVLSSHTNRFKAACVGAGIIDWISDISITDAPTYMESSFGGNYWNNYALWNLLQKGER